MDLIKRFFWGVALWAGACTIAYVVGVSQILLPVFPAPYMVTEGTVANTALFSFLGAMFMTFYDHRRGRQKWEDESDEGKT